MPVCAICYVLHLQIDSFSPFALALGILVASSGSASFFPRLWDVVDSTSSRVPFGFALRASLAVELRSLK